MEKSLLTRKSKLIVKMKAKHIRNRQLHMEPLGRFSQGTRYFDALVETSLYAGEGRERSRKPEMGGGGRDGTYVPSPPPSLYPGTCLPTHLHPRDYAIKF